MIIGAHSIVYSANAEADRAFLRDVLGLAGVDVGGGWLIFALPPAEVAVHPSDEGGSHELFLMCDDVDAFVADLSARQIDCSPVEDLRWGRLTRVRLPGGGRLGVYQPLHARPAAKPARSKSPRRKSAPKPARSKPAPKRPKKPRGARKPPRKPARKRR